MGGKRWQKYIRGWDSRRKKSFFSDYSVRKRDQKNTKEGKRKKGKKETKVGGLLSNRREKGKGGEERKSLERRARKEGRAHPKTRVSRRRSSLTLLGKKEKGRKPGVLGEEEKKKSLNPEE